MTYLIFSYYSADLTARMTLGPPQPSIKSFDDVIKYGYNVMTFEATSWHELLKNSLPGTAMSRVYNEKMDGDPRYIIDWIKAEEAADILFSRENTLLFASFFYALGSNRLQKLEIEVGTFELWSNVN